METESKDPDLAAHAKSVYIAARKVTAKGQKVNLNLKQIVERFTTSRGLRNESKGTMKWFGAYKEWAQSADGGFLTVPEIYSNWKGWQDLANEGKHPRNYDGARGYEQLLIPGFLQDVVAYDQVDLSRSVEQAQKLNKNTTAEEMEAKAAWAGSNMDGNTFGFDEMANRLSLSSSAKSADTKIFSPSGLP